jgi:hypothetical protein
LTPDAPVLHYLKPRRCWSWVCDLFAVLSKVLCFKFCLTCVEYCLLLYTVVLTVDFALLNFS